MRPTKLFLATLFFHVALHTQVSAQISLSTDNAKQFWSDYTEFVQKTGSNIDTHSDQISKLRREIDALKIPFCLVRKWQQDSSGNPSTGLQYLQDRTRHYAYDANEILRLLKTEFGSESNSDLTRFALTITANSGGLSSFREAVLPEIKKEISANKRDIRESVAMIRLVEAKFESRLDSVCRQMASVRQNLVQVNRDVDNLKRHVTQRPSYEVPQRSSCVLYLVQQNFQYQTTTTYTDGTYSTTIHQGDLYENCRGELLVLPPQR